MRVCNTSGWVNLIRSELDCGWPLAVNMNTCLNEESVNGRRDKMWWRRSVSDDMLISHGLVELVGHRYRLGPVVVTVESCF